MNDVNINHGGCAFPSVSESQIIYGMAERDYFAAKAMQGILASGFAMPTQQSHYGNIAEDAYTMADAMIKAREKQNGM